MSYIETKLAEQYSITLLYKNTNSEDPFTNDVIGDGQQRFVLSSKSDNYPYADESPFNYLKTPVETTDFRISGFSQVGELEAGTKTNINNGPDMSSSELQYIIPRYYDGKTYIKREKNSRYTSTVWNSLLKGTFGQSSGGKYYIFLYTSTGLVYLKKDTKIYLNVRYRVVPPKITSEKGIFQIIKPDQTSRKMRITVSEARISYGTRIRNASNAKVVFRLVDVTDTEDVVVWEKQFTPENYMNNLDDDGNLIFDENGLYTFETFPCVYCKDERRYQFRVLYDIATLDYAVKENQTCPKPLSCFCYSPEILDYPDLQIRIPGEELTLSNEQQNFRSMIDAVTGDQFKLYWSDPYIGFASGLRINFQILIGVKGIPSKITDRNILTINPEQGGETLRTFPWQGTGPPEELINEEHKTFIYYKLADSVLTMEEMPIIEDGKYQPNHKKNGEEYNEEGYDEDYPYSYVLTKEQILTFAKNYDSVRIIIRPIILEDFNNDDDQWREGTELCADPDPLNDPWQQLIFLYDSQVRYCSDEYYDEKTKKFYYGDAQWRICHAKYCVETENGLAWKDVTMRWTEDTKEGQKWVFC